MTNFLNISKKTYQTLRHQHIIWDWNGTLLNDNWLSVEAINIVLAQRNLPLLNLERYRDIFTFPVVEYYRMLGFDFKREPFTISGTAFINEYNARAFEPHLHDNIHEILNELSGIGVTHSLLSASGQEILDQLIDFHQLRLHFQKVIGQDNHYAYSKVDTGKTWMAELHYGPHEVLFVGDTIHDLEVAREIGADCVLLSCGHNSHRRLAATGAKVFKNLSEFREWFSL